MNCPRCGSKKAMKNGRTSSGKQNFKCKECGRQFVLEPRHQPISQEKKDMIDRLLLENHEKSKKKSGRPPKLSVEDQILMTLEYFREYRTYFHIGQSWGLDESNVYRTITKVEKILIESKLFRLPGKKALLNQERDSEVVVDVTETPIERPKKNKKSFTAARKRGIH